jgi:hypothetical protein
MTRDSLFRLPLRAALLSILALAVALGAGCDDDEGGGVNTVEIKATGGGKALKLAAPKTVDQGVAEVRFTNSSRVPQGLQLIRVVGDHSVDELLRVVGTEGGPIPNWLRTGGGVGETGPGKARSTTQELPAGQYVALGSSEEGEPPTASFTVEGGEGGGELPETSGRIVADEYSFEASGLTAGRNEVLFENAGEELHHVIALPIKSGNDIRDARRFLETEKGPDPFAQRGSDETTVIDRGVSQVADLKLKQGRYALVCFIQDRKGGEPHANKGMVSEATVE